MSSIIKTGYAPSNIADGKYFLQTDQACFAELKRNRTYICTAQEEAKVSHYVIITNADFTVTFNGDSDLIQVGRANNAIVMNVHRACRIDFVQGGNLEFKEGTADLSSRITMGPNASGNVLVAASLPQQGDFAGQICSLTTGATYVWTGSEWSSTAGTATLPTPTSSNKYHGLYSNGTSWATHMATGAIPYAASINQSGNYYLELYTTTATTYTHLGGDIQWGFHGNLSVKCHVECTVLATTPIIPVEEKTGITLLSNQDSSVYVVGIGHKVVGSTITYYLIVHTTGGWGRATMTNRIVDSDSNPPAHTTMYHESQLSDVIEDNCYIKTSVPVSTASNQMLVSDGNGGWKNATMTEASSSNKNWGLLSDGNGGWIASRSVYGRYEALMSGVSVGEYLIPLADFNDNTVHVACDIQLGQHATMSTKAHVEFVAINGTIQAGRTTVTLLGDNIVAGANLVTGLYVNTTTITTGAKLYIGIKSNGTTSIRCTVYDFVADSGSAEPTDTTFIAKSTETAVGTMKCPVPMPTSADNGKVLKVVSGVPTWASA